MNMSMRTSGHISGINDSFNLIYERETYDKEMERT